MNELSHPLSRSVGVLMTALIIYFFDTQSGSVLHALVLPLALAVAAWLMSRSLMAVAFATLTLAAINTDLSAASWIPRIAYPGIAVIALLTCMVIATRRFRQRIAATHDVRWAQRNARLQSRDPAADTSGRDA